jgi:hypothetical protein
MSNNEDNTQPEKYTARISYVNGSTKQFPLEISMGLYKYLKIDYTYLKTFRIPFNMVEIQCIGIKREDNNDTWSFFNFGIDREKCEILYDRNHASSTAMSIIYSDFYEKCDIISFQINI